MAEIEFSILIGRVSTEDSTRILECLGALRNQKASPEYQVVVVDRLNDVVTEDIRRDYPEVELHLCDARHTLPEMRRMALEQSVGEHVIVTEDHCVPSADWLLAFRTTIQAAPEDVVAVGGCVENGVCDSALDWATFFCEYSNSLAPRPYGYASDIPGMNVAYRRDALTAFPIEQLDKGFWETTVHPNLESQNKRLFSSNDIVLYHCKKFTLGLFCRQRYVYSRYYAGIRHPKEALANRSASAVLSLALPPVLFWRMFRSVYAKKRLAQEFILASPYLLLFTVIWTAGEIAGYILGPGDALLEIE